MRPCLIRGTGYLDGLAVHLYLVALRAGDGGSVHQYDDLVTLYCHIFYFFTFLLFYLSSSPCEKLLAFKFQRAVYRENDVGALDPSGDVHVLQTVALKLTGEVALLRLVEHQFA